VTGPFPVGPVGSWDGLEVVQGVQFGHRRQEVVQGVQFGLKPD
jgi:hypothetical protein